MPSTTLGATLSAQYYPQQYYPSGPGGAAIEKAFPGEAPPVFKAHRLLYHSTLGLTVIKREKSSPRASHPLYRGTSLIRNRAPLGPYSSRMPRALWWSWGGGRFYERGTPVGSCIFL